MSIEQLQLSLLARVERDVLNDLQHDLPPINGTTPAARHASYTGAVHASEARSANITMLRQLWREPRTMQEIATISGLPLSSVCSLKAAIADELIAVGFDVQTWANGRPTKRTQWRMKHKA